MNQDSQDLNGLAGSKGFYKSLLMPNDKQAPRFPSLGGQALPPFAKGSTTLRVDGLVEGKRGF